ncbi:MAG: glycine-rich protein, partial [Acidimicrobiales bacterium]
MRIHLLALTSVGSLVLMSPSTGAGELPPAILEEFSFTGSAQAFVVPDGICSLVVDATGGGGGEGGNSPGSTAGSGGRAVAMIDVTPGETLGVFVGGRGGDGQLGPSEAEGGAGGFNGGGDGGDGVHSQSEALSGGGGGGASDIRRGGSGLEDRVVIAGGGGGSGANPGATFGNGGDGGGLAGADGVAGQETILPGEG